MPVGYWAAWSITRQVYIISQARDAWWRWGEEGRENTVFITQQQLVHEGFVPITDHTSPLHSRKRCTGFSSITGGSRCFGTISQKRKCPLKSLGTILELNLVSAEMVLSSSNKNRFRWEAVTATCSSSDWPQVCCSNMKGKQTESNNNSLNCWLLHLLLWQIHTGDFKAMPIAT